MLIAAKNIFTNIRFDCEWLCLFLCDQDKFQTASQKKKTKKKSKTNSRCARRIKIEFCDKYASACAEPKPIYSNWFVDINGVYREFSVVFMCDYSVWRKKNLVHCPCARQIGSPTHLDAINWHSNNCRCQRLSVRPIESYKISWSPHAHSPIVCQMSS